MRPHLEPGRPSREDAGATCMNRCRAVCCRGPLRLRLASTEVASFRAKGDALGVPVRIVEALDGGGWVEFLEHAGDHCPMLDGETSACRIYADRPRRCREFPERPRPDCLISLPPTR